jgi:hypothetical protein
MNLTPPPATRIGFFVSTDIRSTQNMRESKAVTRKVLRAAH